jgi:hypothetical protein
MGLPAKKPIRIEGLGRKCGYAGSVLGFLLSSCFYHSFLFGIFYKKAELGYPQMEVRS